MSLRKMRKKLNEWKVKDEGLVNRIAFCVYQLERVRKKQVSQPEDLHDATYILAKYAQKMPLPRSPRIILREVGLVVLGQVEAHGIPSISIKRLKWLIRLLSQPYRLGGLGLFDSQLGNDELERICDSVLEDLTKKGLITIDSGSLSLSDMGSRFVNDRLLPCFNSLDHKSLDELIERIDFWLVAVLEYESEIAGFIRAGSKPWQEVNSLTAYLPKKEETLYSKLKPKIRHLIREYRQTLQPYESHVPTLPRKGKLGSIARVERDIRDIARFSRHIGKGVTRLAFTKEETSAMLWTKERLVEFNYECKFDPFLNLHAYDPRKGNQRILIGTHIDTVLNGGQYDGVVGLVSFLEALRLASEQGESFALPVDFIVFRAEESTVFKVALLGSKVATGKLSANDLRNIRFNRDQELKENLAHYYPEYGKLDIKPISLFDVLSKHTDAFTSEIKKGCWFFDYPRKTYVAYIEVHIEQGLVLESEMKDFGIVTSFRAPLREIITIVGKSNHSGATPMGLKYRQDALCAASECIQAIESICNGESAKGVDIVGTVGEQNVPGMGINIVPGKCIFTLDLRSNNLKERVRVHKRIHNDIERICKRRKVKVKFEQTENSKPVFLANNPKSIELQNSLAKAIRKLGLTYMKMASGAGHDAMVMADAGIPTCMLFIPCEAGVSHSPEEKASGADIVRSARVLLQFLNDYERPIETFKDRTLESYIDK